MNFEDPRLAGALDHRTLDELVDAFRQRHRRVRKLYVFLDEIQWVNGWERRLRSQLDRPSGNHFIVSGSNRQLLAGERATSLTGRHWMSEVFPFDLTEAETVGGYLQACEAAHLIFCREVLSRRPGPSPNCRDSGRRDRGKRAGKAGRSMEAEIRAILTEASLADSRRGSADALQAWVDELYGNSKPEDVVDDLIAGRRRQASSE